MLFWHLPESKLKEIFKWKFNLSCWHIKTNIYIYKKLKKLLNFIGRNIYGNEKLNSGIQNEAPLSCNTDKNNFDYFDDENQNEFDHCHSLKKEVKVQS